MFNGMNEAENEQKDYVLSILGRTEHKVKSQGEDDRGDDNWSDQSLRNNIPLTINLVRAMPQKQCTMYDKAMGCI